MSSIFTPENTEVIVSGPGVGKTTEILNRIEKALQDGVPPSEIAFFSFSTTAVNEGLSRIVKRLKYSKNRFRYFKTLHAMAFSLLGLNSKQVMSNPLLQQFARENDLKLSSPDYRTGIVKFQTADSVLLSEIDSARLLNMSIREYFTKNKLDDSSIAKAEDIADKYSRFKLSHGVIDFTDMILLANKSEFDTPHFQYMFIDEAQDLSTQQWKFVEKLAKNTDHIVIVGDERQAIAEFAGADVDYFLKINGKISTLDMSYRVPRNIYNLARKVEKHMVKTRHAMWHPRPLEFGEKVAGEIIRVDELPIADMRFGTWLILVRTNSQIDEFKEYMMQYCTKIPMFFTVNDKAPVDMDIFRAISLFKAGQLSDTVTKYNFVIPAKDDDKEQQQTKANLILLLKKFMSSKSPRTPELDSVFMHRLHYAEWYDAFDKVSIQDRKYASLVYEAYTKNPYAFSNPNIRISTIHSAKGTEADNVVLYTSLTGKVYKDWKRTEGVIDTEEKVLFVGITRAKKRLYLLGNKRVKYSYKELLE